MKKSLFTRFIILVWVSFVAVAYNACSGFEALNGSSIGDTGPTGLTPSEGEGKLAAFEKTVHPLLVQNCSGCHTEGAAVPVSPYFSEFDVEFALSEVEGAGSISEGNPIQSRLVQRLNKDQHNCWGDCEDNAAEMLEAIEEMVALSGPAEPDPRIALDTVTLPVPEQLPDLETGFQTFEWNLSVVGIQGTFKVDIQNFNGTYRFAKPTFSGLQENVMVKNLAFKFNDVSRDQENTFSAIDFQDTELSTRQLSGATLIALPVVDANEDPVSSQLTPVFDIIQGIGTQPRPTPTYQQVQTVLTNNCVGCHGNVGGNLGARNFETFTGLMAIPEIPDPDGGEATVLPPAVKAGDATGSLLFISVKKQTGEVGFMPQGGAQLAPTDQQTIEDWINGGASSL